MVQAAIDALLEQTKTIERIVAALDLGPLGVRGLRQPGRARGRVPVGRSARGGVAATDATSGGRGGGSRGGVGRGARRDDARAARRDPGRDHGFRRGGAVGDPVRRLGDLSRRREPQRLLAALGQSELRAARRLLRRQRPVPAQLGDRAVIDPGRRRSGAAVQRARLPGLPSQGRARPPAGGAGQFRGLDVPAPVDPARRARPSASCSRAIGRTSSPSRPTAASCRISRFPATRPRGAW